MKIKEAESESVGFLFFIAVEVNLCTLTNCVSVCYNRPNNNHKEKKKKNEQTFIFELGAL